jgi:hypothetical protein
MTEIIKFSEIVEANGKTIRENNLEIEHKIPIGALVEVEITKHFANDTSITGRVQLYVIEHTRDCDGSPLYTLGKSLGALDDPESNYKIRLFWMWMYGIEQGYPESSLTVVEE